jgi:hypothetical protein
MRFVFAKVVHAVTGLRGAAETEQLASTSGFGERADTM